MEEEEEVERVWEPRLKNLGVEKEGWSKSNKITPDVGTGKDKNIYKKKKK